MFVACAQEPKQPERQQQESKQQGEFIPLSELPPTEQIPAARLLIGAYSVVIVGLFLYVVSVGGSSLSGMNSPCCLDSCC